MGYCSVRGERKPLTRPLFAAIYRLTLSFISSASLSSITPLRITTPRFLTSSTKGPSSPASLNCVKSTVGTTALPLSAISATALSSSATRRSHEAWSFPGAEYSSSFALTAAKRGGRGAKLALPLRDGKMEEMSPFFLGGRTWVGIVDSVDTRWQTGNLLSTRGHWSERGERRGRSMRGGTVAVRNMARSTAPLPMRSCVGT